MFFRSKPQALSRKQREFWQRLNEYIREGGGWTVSQPDTSPLRFECEQGSDLPDLLRQAGHDARFLGTHERLMPQSEVVTEHASRKKVTRQHVAPGIAGVYQLDLPNLDAPQRDKKDDLEIL
jgi:hypothetical protein